MADCNSMQLTKACSRCKSIFPATGEFFNAHKMGKYGLDPACKTCKKACCAELRARPDQKKRQQEWRDANKGYIKAYNEAYRAAGYTSTAHVAAWRARNLEYCREYDRLKRRRYYAQNPEKFRAIQRAAYGKNRDRCIAYNLHRYRTDPATNLKQRMASRLRKALCGRFPCKSSFKVFGFTKAELVAHIERQFTKGMTWEKLMAGKIHIDHIIPVASFNIKEIGDAEFKACWSLSNLRPMWAAENWSKSKKLLTLL